MEFPKELRDHGWVNDGGFHKWGKTRAHPTTYVKNVVSNITSALRSNVWVYEGSDGSWWTVDRHCAWRGYPDLDTAIAATLLGRV